MNALFKAVHRKWSLMRLGWAALLFGHARGQLQTAEENRLSGRPEDWARYWLARERLRDAAARDGLDPEEVVREVERCFMEEERQT